jgi:DNA-binding transcriptional ArsR family regulator
VDELHVVVQEGTGYDLLLSATLVADRSARGRIDRAAQLQRRVASGDPAIAQTLRAIGREPFITLLGWVHAMVEEPSAMNVIAAIEAADSRALMFAALGHDRRAFRLVTPPAVIRAAVDGDKAAIQEFRRTSYPGLSQWQATLRHFLGRAPAEFRADLATALRGLYDLAFAAMEPEIAEVQAHDASVVRNYASTRDLHSILEEVAPGITFAREVGQDWVVLVPSVVARPGWAITDHGRFMLIAYSATKRDEPERSPEDIARLGRALGDEVRIRALRELRSGPMSTSELARRLGVPRTSLQHHVSVLLMSGLVAMAVDDAQTGALELRPNAIRAVGRLLATWVLAEDGTEGADGSDGAEDR